MRYLLDTDIGSDIDDALALLYAASQGLQFDLITTVHGDTACRARIARKLCDLVRYDAPVVAGESVPLRQTHIYATGLEGKGFVNARTRVPTHGVDALIEEIMANKHDVTIAAIGPLTNLARVFERHPKIASYISGIYMMGNAILTPKTYYVNYRSHNFKVDPEAVDIVMGADVPKTIITTEVAKKSALSRAVIQALGRKHNPAFKYVRNAGIAWMDFIKYSDCYLYDPLVVHHLMDDAITAKKTYGNVRITTGVDPGFAEHVAGALKGWIT